MTFFEYVRRHAKAFLFTVVLLTLSGTATVFRMPVSLFPDVTFPRIVILADNGEEPSERMMVEVTKPLEEVAGSIPGVNIVRSITNRGSTEISVGLDWSANVQEVLQLLQGRIANIRNTLPSTAAIEAEQMTVSVFPILGYSLTSDSLDLVQLRDIALYQIRPALLRVHGVARVDVMGGDTREFAVIVSPAKLAAYHLDIRQVSDAIAKTNIVGSSGRVYDNYQMYLSLISGLLHSVDDIKAVVVSSQGGIPVRVGDVADVTPSAADRIIRTTAHGRDAVLINILKHPTGSTVQIGQDANAEVRALALPRGVRFENFYDQGDFISNSIRGTRDSIAVGIVLAMLVLFIFLRNLRMTLVITLVVPATIATTLLCLNTVGLTINIMTLGGMAAAVGLIIDDSIVVIEYVFTRLAQRQASGSGAPLSFGEAIAPSLKELFPAVLGSTASTIVIHIPLAFLGGITGAFFASLSITMVIAMLTSFVFSISFAPLLAADFLRTEDVRREIEREARSSRIADWYERTMRRLLRFRLLAIPAALVLLVLVYVLYDQIGNSFMPDMDEGTFVLDYASPPGTSLDETNRILMNVESILMSVPEVVSYSRRTGTELGFFLTEPNSGDFLVKLRSERKRSIEEVIDEVRTRVETSQPSLRIEFGQLMMDVIGDLTNSPSPVEIKLFGEEKELLERKAREVKQLIETVPGVVDAFDGIVVSGPNVTLRVDPIRAAQAGFSGADLRDEMEAVIRGRAETSIQKGEKLMAVRVRYPEQYHTEIERIEGTVLYNSSGAAVPLKNIIAVERNPGQTEIRRERLRQMVAVKARISGRDLGHTITDIKARLASRFSIPPGVSLEFGGIYQTQQESFRGLLIVAIAAFMLVFLVLLIEFGEFAVPLSIFVVNVLSLLGVFGMLWLARVSFNISSFVGIIMIIGIVAENAIFVVHAAWQRRTEGMPLDDALIEAGKVRARPILMTTLAAVLALLPLALGLGAGTQMQQPLAIAVIGGFSVSSLLLFFALPLFYRLFAQVRRPGSTENS
jgi:CzcA family heavy metal efflux pump